MPPEPSQPAPPCHVHDEVEDWKVDDIRARVCRDLPRRVHADGKDYCLLHLPSKDKDVAAFEQIIAERMREVDERMTDIDALPEDEQAEAKSKISYDFRYVWFPVEVKFYGQKFLANAYFSSATFTADASFSSATFTAYANFSSATLTADAYFSWATFMADAYFSSATFAKIATFADTIFFSLADFATTKFPETCEAFFKRTRFCQKTIFMQTLFEGFISFEGSPENKIFLDDGASRKISKELNEKFSELQKELATRGIKFKIPNALQEPRAAVLDLQNARLKKPERIVFHTVRLRPNWFVNTDPRKFVFTDCRWDNTTQSERNANIADEIRTLQEREIGEQKSETDEIKRTDKFGTSEQKRLLEIACRQLAVNAEENNRYEDASKFRYMAMETKRLEYRWRGVLWTLTWWYRVSSGYGENWRRAGVMLLAVIFSFGLLFATPLAKFDYGEPKPPAAEQLTPEETRRRDAEAYNNRFHAMGVREGIVHSLNVAALQRPEPKPADRTTRLLIILETIFAPLQAALLALAIRRKFMR